MDEFSKIQDGTSLMSENFSAQSFEAFAALFTTLSEKIEKSSNPPPYCLRLIVWRKEL